MDDQLTRLKNRLRLCQDQIRFQDERLQMVKKDLAFWAHELVAAERELGDLNQLELEDLFKSGGMTK